MKFALAIIVLFTYFISISSQRLLNIEGGRYNATKDTIEIDVQYTGGCKEHEFELKMGICRQSYPVRCDAQLIDHTTDDVCKALVYETISISLHQVGLDDSYYKGASVQIQSAYSNSKIHITLSN